MKKQKFVINQKLPDFNSIISSAKSRYSYNMYGYTALSRQTIDQIRMYIREYRIMPVKQCFLDITWREKNRRRDPDNIAASIKFILDALQKEEILKNDGWKQIAGWRNSFCVEKEYSVVVHIQET